MFFCLNFTDRNLVRTMNALNRIRLFPGLDVLTARTLPSLLLFLTLIGLDLMTGGQNLLAQQPPAEWVLVNGNI